MPVTIFEDGANGRLNNRIADPFDVGNAGAPGDGVADAYLAFRNAAQTLGTSGSIYVPPGTYRIGTNLTINCGIIFANGATVKPDSGVTLTLAGPVTTAPGESVIAAGTLGAVTITGPVNGSGVLDVRTFGAVGDGVTDDTAAIQRTIDAAEAAGGGTILWADAYITNTLTIQASNIRIIPGAGRVLRLGGAIRHAFQVYPTTLDGIVNNTSRPANFPSGIDGEGYETLMYEPTDASRLRNVAIEGLEYEFVGSGSSNGRFVDAYSVDFLTVKGNTVECPQNGIIAWYCRDVRISNNAVTETGASNGFNVFLFKSYGDVNDNVLTNGIAGVDVKGCYPQAGKGVTDAFDAGYLFYHPARVFRNRISEFTQYGVQAGYFDNSGDDISGIVVTGITKKQWYGQVWGAEVFDNVFTTAQAGTDNCSVRTNINAWYCKVYDNVCYRAGIFCIASYGCEFVNNVIVGANQTSTASIQVRGGTYGADSLNSRYCVVRGNRIFNQVTVEAGIRMRGADDCTVEDNVIVGHPNSSGILVDSSASASTSTRNIVVRNRVQKTAADFQYPFASTGAAFTIMDNNRAYGGWYTGNALESDGFANPWYARGVVSADTPTANVGTPGTCYVGANFGDENATTPQAGFANEMVVNGPYSSTWRQPARLGEFFLWVDGTGDLRIDSTRPASSTAGTVVGTQT